MAEGVCGRNDDGNGDEKLEEKEQEGENVESGSS